MGFYTDPEPPLTPGRYKHFKGGFYEVFGVARYSEGDEWVVIYKSVDHPRIVVRPLRIFIERVSLPDGTEVPRFELLSPSMPGPATELEEVIRRRLPR